MLQTPLGSVVRYAMAGSLLAGCASAVDRGEPPTGAIESASTTVNGIDYSYSQPTAQAVASAGYSFVARYVSPESGKNLTSSEESALEAAGVDLILVWEDASDNALSGYSQGVTDAQAALSQANALGMPADRPIYFAVDFQPTGGQVGTVDNYFSGIASVLPVSRIGAYAGYDEIKHLFDTGEIQWGWQTYAWSSGQWDPRDNARQVQNGITVGGANVDADQAMTADFGQWGPGAVGKFPILTGDFNGDGKSDTAYWGLCGSPAVNCWRVHLSTGSGYTTANWGGAAAFVDVATYGIQTGDFNGDGKTDIAYYGVNGSTTGWVVQLSTGSSFAAPASWTASDIFIDPKTYGIQTGDFNGDGKTDIVYYGNCGSPAAPCWRMHLSTGSGFTTANWGNGTWFNDPATYGIQVGDFNGDGKADIAYYGFGGNPTTSGWRIHFSTGSSFGTPSLWVASEIFIDPKTYGIQAGDFNGDGKTDIAYYGNCGSPAAACWRVHLSTGSGFTTANWGNGTWFNNPARYGIQVGDYNGDGFADLSYWGFGGNPTTAGWRIHPSTGSSFGAPALWTASEWFNPSL